MSTQLDTALLKVRAQLLADFSGAVVEGFPYDVDPRVLAESSINWPAAGVPLFTLIHGAVTAEDRDRSPAGTLAIRMQHASVDVIAWMRGPSAAGMASAALDTGRALIESIEAVAKAWPWGRGGSWQLDWEKRDTKPTRYNDAFYVAIRVGIVVDFEE